MIEANTCLAKSRKSYCTTPGIGVGGDGGGGGIYKKFNVKIFYVMGKALSGELSCPCDRSCYMNQLANWPTFCHTCLTRGVQI